MREKYIAKLLHIKNKCLYLYEKADKKKVAFIGIKFS